MFHRVLDPTESQSFFLFGARGSGKTTYIQKQLKRPLHYISFLEEKWERRYSQDADLLKNDILALPKKASTWVVLDEVQKVPKILDTVHSLIEEHKIKFILTGSSARKLKRKSANLLAGRAFQYQMFPLTHLELLDRFDLEEILNWGSLPNIFSLTGGDREEFLRSYCQTYLKEEILQEQVARNGFVFRQFLELAAQENGNSLNFSKMGRDMGADVKTVQNYFQILEDTLLGFFLPAFHHSTRKSVKLAPKFYLFDLGIKKALDGQLQNTLRSQTAAFGRAFEHFVVCESYRLNSYRRKDYGLYHYQTTAGGEIDLVLKKGREVIAVEIKSTQHVDRTEVGKLERVSEPLKPTAIYYISRDTVSTKIGKVHCLPWQKFFADIFG